MMIDIGLAFIIGLIVGLVMRPQDKDITEQKRIYDQKLAEYEYNIQYYKNLCKWHVEQRNAKASN